MTVRRALGRPELGLDKRDHGSCEAFTPTAAARRRVSENEPEMPLMMVIVIFALTGRPGTADSAGSRTRNHDGPKGPGPARTRIGQT